MIGFLSDVPERRRTTRASIEARALVLDPTLTAGSEQLDAAAVLVAGHEIGHNIDRIARITGVAREAVARMARRLVDNGVWHSGDTVSSWCDSSGPCDSFAQDVAVAEGRLCRRSDGYGGFEWAPPGYWRKEFEYAGAKGDDPARPVRYHAHVAVPESECLYVPDDELADEDGEDESAGVVGSAEEAHRAPPVAAEPAVGLQTGDVAHLWLGGEDAEAPAGDAWRGDLADPLGGPDGGAVWLGWSGSTPQPVGD